MRMVLQMPNDNIKLKDFNVSGVQAELLGRRLRPYQPIHNHRWTQGHMQNVFQGLIHISQKFLFGPL